MQTWNTKYQSSGSFYPSRPPKMSPWISLTSSVHIKTLISSSTFTFLPCKKCDTDCLMSFWRQFGLVRKWDQIPWKFHDFSLSKIHVTFQHGKQINRDKWHGIVMEFGVNLDQTAVDFWRQKWLGISLRTNVTFSTGNTVKIYLIYSSWVWTWESSSSDVYIFYT